MILLWLRRFQKKNLRLRSPIGRGNGLKIRPVWVRLPPELFMIDDQGRPRKIKTTMRNSLVTIAGDLARHVV